MIYEKELYHNLILHFPIALLVIGYFFDFASVAFKNDLFYKFSFWNLGLGIITGIFSIITGFIKDNANVKSHITNPFDIWTTHGSNMIVAIILFYVIFIVKFYWGSIVNRKLLLFFHTLVICFFIHGADLGAKLAGRLF